MVILHVASKIAQEIIKRGVQYGRLETKIWKGLYGPSGRFPGVSNYKHAARGVKHGLASGAALGSFISDPSQGGDDAISQSVAPSTGPFDKARSRPAVGYNSRYNRNSKSRRGCRCPNPRYNKAGRNWKYR